MRASSTSSPTAPGASAPSQRDPRLRRRDRARGLPLLLPPALPARQRRARPPQAHERAARAHAGCGRGVRRPRTAGSAPTTVDPGQALAAGRGRSSARSAGPSRRTRRSLAEESAALRERVGRDRHDVVRQDRRLRARRGCAARAGLRRARRPQPGQRRLHAVPRRARRHRRRRDRHAPRRAIASASSRALPRSTPTWAGCGCTSATTMPRSSFATRPGSSA